MRSTRTAPPSTGRIAASLDQLMMWARRQTPAQMSTTSIATLATLSYRGPMRISDLADGERISQPGMTTLVNRLTQQGLAERVADPSDGRATLVYLTDAGRALLEERHAHRSDALSTQIRQLSSEHQQALADALPAINQLIAQTKSAAHDGSAMFDNRNQVTP